MPSATQNGCSQRSQVKLLIGESPLEKRCCKLI
jgi:hypothetical protein